LNINRLKQFGFEHTELLSGIALTVATAMIVVHHRTAITDCSFMQSLSASGQGTLWN
jgi:hypothetical protein